MDEKDFIVSPDEANAEQEALAEAKEAEVRAKVVADLGLTDDDTNKAVIDAVVARELGHKKKLSEAIGQKINWREKAKASKPAPTQQQQQNAPLDVEAVRKQTETTVKEQLEQRDLDEMDHSDEIKAEIKRVAQVQNISVRKAEQDPYIQFKITQAQATDRATNGAATRSPKSIPASDSKMPAFDFMTEAGRKQYADWKDQKKKQG